MRDEWYGDKRDLLKWGVLLTLAERYEAEHILQVLYYRPKKWSQIEVDGEIVDLPDSVVKHFRTATSICSISPRPRIEVIPEEFSERDDYTRLVLGYIRTRTHLPGIVFLDPDTGLQPATASPHPEHVLNAELTEIWSNLGSGDVLVVYQHQTNRNGTEWVPEKKAQFERALGIPKGQAKLAQATTTPRDVILLYAQKTS